MNRVSYDDWNIQQEDKELKPFNLKRNCAVFLICSFILIIAGIINIYSVTFPGAVMNGLESFHYVKKFSVFVVSGTVAGLVLMVLPRPFIGILSFVCCICTSAFLWMNYYLKLGFVFDEVIYSFILTSSAIYMSSHFAKNNNCIDRYSFLAVPVIISVAVLWGILLNGNITFAVLFIILTGFIFLACGCGLAGFLLLLLYFAVPLTVWAFTKQQNIDSLVRFFFAETSGIDFQKSMRLQCISEAGLTGTGIGLGSYKNFGIDGISDVFIFCSLIDETGLAGASAVIILFVICFVCCIKSIIHTNSFDVWSSNTVLSLGMIVFAQFVLNCIQIFNILPLHGITMPFFSFSVNVAVNIIQVFIIFKFMHAKSSDKVKKSMKYSEEAIFGEK